jgi:cell division protein FtsZ
MEFAVSDSVKVKIVGVGKAGRDAIARVDREGMENVEYLAIHRDASVLFRVGVTKMSPLARSADTKTEGLPWTYSLSEREHDHGIRESIRDARIVIIVAGLGGKTGSNLAPHVARIAKELNILTVAFVSKPFMFEGERLRYAEKAIDEIAPNCDSLFILDGEKMLKSLGDEVSVDNAFSKMNDALRDGVSAIADVLASPGMVNIDFEDVETLLRAQGEGYLGSGIATGEDRAMVAARIAMSSPFLNLKEIRSANGVLVSINASRSLKMREVNEIMNVIRESVADDAMIIFGAIYSEDIGSQLRVTILATGLRWTDTNRRRVENGCNISIALGGASTSDVVDLFSALSDLHRACGGVGIALEEPGIAPAKRAVA